MPEKAMLIGEEGNLGLVQRCQENDPEAYSELFNLYSRRIFNTAYRILGEESSAEDALQETLLNVYRGLSSFRGDSKFSTWVGRITINVCLGMLRKAKNKLFVDMEDESAADLHADETDFSDPLRHASLSELRGLIETAFLKMTPRQGTVVRLHDMEGYTIVEIAKKQECPVGTIKSRLFYGRQEFKEIFSDLLRSRNKKPTIN